MIAVCSNAAAKTAWLEQVAVRSRPDELGRPGLELTGFLEDPGHAQGSYGFAFKRRTRREPQTVL